MKLIILQLKNMKHNNANGLAMRMRTLPPPLAGTSFSTLIGPYGVFSFISISRAARRSLVSSSSGKPCFLMSFSVLASPRWLTWGNRLLMASRSSNFLRLSAFMSGHSQVRILHAHMFQTVHFAVARIISLRELFITSCA